MFSSRNYAIGLAHFRIAGGWRSLFYLCVGYIAVGFLIAGIIFYASRTPTGIPRRAFLDFAAILMIIESFILVFFGSARVAACIRNDLMSNMIESHRLMPIASWRAVLGYFVGAILHPLAITLINMAAVFGFALYAGVSADTVIVSQAVLFGFALFVWAFTTVGTFMFRQMIAITALGLMLGTCAGLIQEGASILPGTTLILSPFIGDTIFVFSRTHQFLWGYPVALAVQAAFIALFFVGACRRYRGTYPSTFSDGQGLLLTGLWTLVSMIAILAGHALEISFRWRRDPLAPGFRDVQVVASLASAMLLATVPVWSLVAEEKIRRLKRWQAFVVCALTVGMIVPLASAPTVWRLSMAVPAMVTVAVIAAHIATVYFTLQIFRRASMKISFIGLGMVLGSLWILPIVAELIRWYFMEPDWDKARLGVIATISPIGLLASQWTTDAPASPLVGLLIQVAFAVALGLLVLRRDRKLAAPAPA